MRQKVILIIAGLIVLAGVAYAAYVIIPKIQLPAKIIQSLKTQPGFYPVTEVVDGDTITINMDSKEERVRLIGTDTPETKKPDSPVECFGVGGSNYAH